MIETTAPVLTGWLATLNNNQREQTLCTMRGMRDDATRLIEKSRSTPGTVEVGGRLQDFFMQGEALHSYLRALNAGCTPIESEAQAKQNVRFMVEKWNQKRGYQTQRSPIIFDDFLAQKTRILLGGVAQYEGVA